MADPVFFPRFSAERVTNALKDTPVVMVVGPRQSGKTTLVREFVDRRRVYLTLDDDTVLDAARTDPAGFVRGLDSAIIDEVQRAPDLLRAIKRSVDNDRQAGRFLLTGSANVLTLPRVSESLAGRMEIVNLFPLCQSEILGTKPTFLNSAFSGKVNTPVTPTFGNNLIHAALVGGYPEMVLRKNPLRRAAWARDYVSAILQRDIRDIAALEKLDLVPRLLRVLAQHSAQLSNFTQIGNELGLDDKTARKYIAILEQLFLVGRVEPWFRNRLKRLIKTPKLHFLDSGLLAAMLGVSAKTVAKDRSAFGPLLETFVFSEITKQADWYDERCVIYHYRDKDQDEVDLVVENDRGQVVGVEVKAAATVKVGDFKGLRKMLDVCGEDFKLGVVLYDGEQVIPFGERIFAAPVSCTWN